MGHNTKSKLYNRLLDVASNVRTFIHLGIRFHRFSRVAA